jgi:hypothetical protein
MEVRLQSVEGYDLQPCEIDEKVGTLILNPSWRQTPGDTSVLGIAHDHGPSRPPYIINTNVDTPVLGHTVSFAELIHQRPALGLVGRRRGGQLRLRG